MDNNARKELFNRACEYFLTHTSLKFNHEQSKAFQSFSEELLEKLEYSFVVEVNDSEGIGLPRRGGNTTCLEVIIAILMVTHTCKTFRVSCSSYKGMWSMRIGIQRNLMVFEKSKEFRWKLDNEADRHIDTNLTNHMESNKSSLEFSYPESGNETEKINPTLPIMEKNQEDNTKLFDRACDYFFLHSPMSLSSKQRDAFHAFTKKLLLSMGDKNTITLSDMGGIGLPRRGGNTACLQMIAAILMVSVTKRIHIYCTSNEVMENMAREIEKHLKVFENSDQYGWVTHCMSYTMLEIKLQNIGKRRFAYSSVSFSLDSDPIPETAHETKKVNEKGGDEFSEKLEEIKTKVSSKFRDIALVLFGFVRHYKTQFSLKEEPDLLEIDLDPQLKLIVAPIILQESRFHVVFQSFIRGSFDYPSRCGEIIQALDGFFSLLGRDVKEIVQSHKSITCFLPIHPAGPLMQLFSQAHEHCL